MSAAFVHGRHPLVSSYNINLITHQKKRIDELSVGSMSTFPQIELLNQYKPPTPKKIKIKIFDLESRDFSG